MCLPFHAPQGAGVSAPRWRRRCFTLHTAVIYSIKKGQWLNMSRGLRNSSSSEEWQAVSFLRCAVITLPGQSCPGMQLPRHTAIPVTARCLLFPSTAALICTCQQIGTARQPQSEPSVEEGGVQGHGEEGRTGRLSVWLVSLLFHGGRNRALSTATREATLLSKAIRCYRIWINAPWLQTKHSVWV